MPSISSREGWASCAPARVQKSAAARVAKATAASSGQSSTRAVFDQGDGKGAVEAVARSGRVDGVDARGRYLAAAAWESACVHDERALFTTLHHHCAWPARA